MPAEPEPRFVDLLEVLVRGEVSFVLIGGVAAILHGAPIMTADLDIVFDRSEENVQRLYRVLTAAHALYRDPAGRRITPDESKLSTLRMHLLATDFGPLDVLVEAGDGLRYADLVARSKVYEVAGFDVRVLDLDAIIETKVFANRPKDRAVLPILRGVLARLEAPGQAE